jgi:hypothetical protein
MIVTIFPCFTLRVNCERRRRSPRVVGVAFFDFQHGQTGVAPNAIELHPILDFACLRLRASGSGL